MEKHFETTGPITLSVDVIAGDIRLVVTDEPTTTVTLTPHGSRGQELMEQMVVEANGNDVTVSMPHSARSGFRGGRGSVDVEVALATGSTVEASTGSGDVLGDGGLGDVKVSSGSGDIVLHDVEAGNVSTGSGDIRVRSVRQRGRLKTGSGDVHIDSAHADVELVSGSGDISVRRAESGARVKTGSGDVEVGASHGDVDVMTASGDVTLSAVHGGQVRVKTGTGDVTIGVPPGVAAHLDLSTVTGDVDVDLDDAAGPGDAEATAALVVHNGSGDVRVVRAATVLS